VGIMGRMKAACLYLDTLDDRRELFALLHRLPPRRRVAYVEGLCRGLTIADGLRRGVSARTHALAELARRDDSADRRLTLDLYMDCWHLCVQYGLDLPAAAQALEALVRRTA
jgi:hypothetical protein